MTRIMNGLRHRFTAGLGVAMAAAMALAACGANGTTAGGNGSDNGEPPSLRDLRGTVQADGSSTVFPITEAVAEEFGAVAPRVRAQVGVSGTGGGFERFCRGETDISNASRPIKDTEAERCVQAGIDLIELTVALDGLAVLVNPQNDFVDYLSVEELRKIWEPGSRVNRWSQVRPGWPDSEIKLFGPGTDSGTFDYFTEEVMGESGASRSDYTASEDDNVLVQGIAGERGALGYFGFAYYQENQSRLKAVPIDSGSGPVMPTPETIESGEYSPLSRPIFIYVKTASLRDKPQVREFISFYLEQAPVLVPDVGYVALSESRYAQEREKLTQAVG